MKKVMTGAQAIVECIKLEGIRHAFCVPGESYLELLDAIYEEESIQLISNRHEGGAAFMAEAYGKATGKPGIAMATRGVGGANLSIGVHTAHQDSTPMVVFLGQVDSKFRGREGFQEVELDQFFQHICKWAVEIRDVERTPELVQRAFRIARTGRPGPVIVSLPADVLSQKAEMVFGPVITNPKPKPADLEISQSLQVLKNSERPLIIAGGGVIASNGEENLLRFAEKYNVPVLASFRRHDVFPNNHELYVGHSGLGTPVEILDTIKQADSILAIGTRFSEVTTQGYSVISNNQKIIHIDIDFNTIGKVYSPVVGMVADANEALESLLAAEDVVCIPQQWKNWAAERRSVYETISGIKEEKHHDEVDLKQIIAVLQKHAPTNTIFTNDAGNFSGWLHNFYQFNHPKTYIGPISGAMGYGVPAAVGIKLARPECPVVSLSGDGGFMMTLQELETAVRYNVPIISLVINNNMYGTIRMHQEMHHPERVIGTRLGNPDFKKLGESFRVFSARVTCDADFEEVFLEAMRSNKPALIEVVCDPNKISFKATIESIRTKHKQQLINN
ncbi:thiamine pyrophosphate-binding protein [Schinkia azotoformans]|uniref:Thiamine pyrophosphate protein n=1 Tax=Schinkia azotoformans LMG 9581 TaxID=1131731 RepID=K6BWY4_SCHAZ|nr:thiamine pyrophosphate-dependent enzyme [Schinkia azotoformans]EKN63455.1 thiamine pyrophosphate protein [Schinkia azotoformans LMG 9581]MEC1638754.1 thiamine pyrophosphate-binding protein [Schinkia azotoformans]MEC1946719.1 thiamine pyrophosphate-binding protein [Schinkia azotoformans]